MKFSMTKREKETAELGIAWVGGLIGLALMIVFREQFVALCDALRTIVRG